MLVFVDESGDPGLKLGQGSSKYFIVTAVIFEELDEAQAIDLRIGLLRRELNLSQDYEFHFSKNKAIIRETFLKAVGKYDFFYFSIVINKKALYGEGFNYKESFYKYACSLVFENAKPYLNMATIIIDGSGSREFRNQLGTYLRRKINNENNRYIKKVKIKDSRKNNLIQMADMICGAVYRSFKLAKKSDSRYRDIVKHREIYVQFWPRDN